MFFIFAYQSLFFLIDDFPEVSSNINKTVYIGLMTKKLQLTHTKKKKKKSFEFVQNWIRIVLLINRFLKKIMNLISDIELFKNKNLYEEFL